MRHSHYKTTSSRSRSVAIFLVIVVGVSVLVLQLMWVQRNRDKLLGPATVAVFKQIIRSQTVTINCDVCKGAGYIVSPLDTTVTNECGVCFGSRKHTIRIRDDHESICPTCLGMGRVLIDPATGRGATCPTCAGRGVLAQEIPEMKPLRGARVKIECYECNGLGTLDEKMEDGQRKLCPLCFGVGYHTVFKYKPEHAICPACGGLGRLFDSETGEARFCQRCDGGGVILLERAPTTNRPPAQVETE